MKLVIRVDLNIQIMIHLVRRQMPRLQILCIRDLSQIQQDQQENRWIEFLDYMKQNY